MKVLIVIDMQNDFIDGALGSPEARAIVPVMEKRMAELADGNTALFYTKDTHFDGDYLNTQEGRNLPVPHCICNTQGWEINERIKAVGMNDGFCCPQGEKGGSIYTKTCFGSYWLPRGIDDLLCLDEENDEIILMGVCTDICVVSNALILKSYFPETKITVDASCCAGTTPENHKAALQTMKSCQINVIND